MGLLKEDMEERYNDISELQMDINDSVNVLIVESRRSSVRLANKAIELGLDKIRDRRKKTNMN